jgi:peroxiredoxin
VDALKAAGIDEVIVYCVNDGAVMSAWAEDQGVDKSDFITLMGDPTGALTDALDMNLSHAGPQGKGLIGRCKRFALYLVNGVVKVMRVAEGGPAGEEDPAGDDFPEVTLAPAMLEAIKSAGKDEL